MATENVTGALSFPAEPGFDSGAGVTAPLGCGLVDVSASAAGHATGATPSLQREVAEFFARCAQQAEAAPGEQPPPPQQGEEPGVEPEPEPEPAPAPTPAPAAPCQ